MKSAMPVIIAAMMMVFASNAWADEVPPGGTWSAISASQRRSENRENAGRDGSGGATSGQAMEEVPPAGVPGLTPGGGPRTIEPQPVNIVVIEGRRWRRCAPVSVGVGVGYTWWRGSHWRSNTYVGVGYQPCIIWYDWAPCCRPYRYEYWVGFSSHFPIWEDRHSRWSAGWGVGVGGGW